MVSSIVVNNELVRINGIDKGLKEGQEAQGDIDVRTEGLEQVMESSQAEVTARYEARLGVVLHMVKDAKLKARVEEMKCRDEAVACEAAAVRVAIFEAKVARLQAQEARAAEAVRLQVQEARAERKAQRKERIVGAGGGMGSPSQNEEKDGVKSCTAGPDGLTPDKLQGD